MSLPSRPVTAENSGPEYRRDASGDPADITLLRQPNGGYDLTLRVVALPQVLPHEHFHGPRVAELIERIRADGKLINPPLVAQQGDKYVVLDGATRLTAFRQMGIPFMVVQVVSFDQGQVQLTSWNHAVTGGSPAALLATLGRVAGLQLTPVGKWNPDEAQVPGGALGFLVTRQGDSYLLEPRSGGVGGVDEGWLRVFNALMERYGEWGNIERTLISDVPLLTSHFPDLAALVIFPHFTPQTILGLAAQGRTVPAGITRFVISGRILRLNAPIDQLAVDEPLAAKQVWLDGLIREKLRARQVRYYEEPVVLLDE
jgi:hypothetical protein